MAMNAECHLLMDALTVGFGALRSVSMCCKFVSKGIDMVASL